MTEPSPPDFPLDATGDVFRRMIAHGDDLTRPRKVDFEHVMPSRDAAEEMGRCARELGYEVSLTQLEGGEWDAQCSIVMLPTYEEVTQREASLGRIAGELGGHSDGWGCFQQD